MIDSRLQAIIKKDFRSVTSNSRLFSILLIVPLVMVVVMPTIFFLVIAFSPLEELSDFQAMLAVLPAELQTGSLKQTLVEIMINKIIPLFFLIIPIMAASVMSAGAFVGEKEKRTLETLLYSPLTLGQVYQAKVLACFLLSMLVTLLSFAAMLLVVEILTYFILGGFLFPGLDWLAIVLLVAPALSFIAITLIVRGSAKAQTMEESQQRSVFLILPLIALTAGQFTGLLLLNVWILLGLGVVLAAVAFILVRVSASGFTYEKLSK